MEKLTIGRLRDTLSGRRVFVRIDGDVPRRGATGEIADDFKLQQVVPTLRLLIEAGGSRRHRHALGTAGRASGGSLARGSSRRALEPHLGTARSESERMRGASGRTARG